MLVAVVLARLLVRVMLVVLLLVAGLVVLAPFLARLVVLALLFARTVVPLVGGVPEPVVVAIAVVVAVGAVLAQVAPVAAQIGDVAPELAAVARELLPVAADLAVVLAELGALASDRVAVMPSVGGAQLALVLAQVLDVAPQLAPVALQLGPVAANLRAVLEELAAVGAQVGAAAPFAAEVALRIAPVVVAGMRRRQRGGESGSDGERKQSLALHGGSFVGWKVGARGPATEGASAGPVTSGNNGALRVQRDRRCVGPRRRRAPSPRGDRGNLSPCIAAPHQGQSPTEAAVPVSRPLSWMQFAALAALLAGCGSTPVYRAEKFTENTPYSKRVQGSGEVVCWSVKRAFLTQGYLLERSSDPVIVTGTKDVQSDDVTNETLRLQATCVDNHDGTSDVFASANYEVSKLQRTPQSVSAGVSLATITVPAGSETRLALQSRETVKDPQFYERFYALVERFAREEERNTASSGSSRRR